MLLLTVTYSRAGWCSISGMWILHRETKLVKCVHDAAPVKVGTPVAVVEQEDELKLMETIHKVEVLTSVATCVGLCKHVLGKKRVFVKLGALGRIDEDLVKACACGGVDGIVPVPKVEQKELFGIPIVNIYEESQPHYVYVRLLDLANIKNAQGKVYGVIVEFFEKPKISTILNIRSYVFRHLGSVDLFIACPHLVFTHEFLKEVKDLVDGVVLTTLGNIVLISVDRFEKDVHVARCTSCRVDFISQEHVKKCPYCSERLTELLKTPTERMFSYTARELRFISNEFLSSYDPAKFRIEVR